MFSENVKNEAFIANEHISDELTGTSTQELTESIKITQQALDLFLNNHYDDSKRLLKNHAGSRMYAALGYATVMFMQAVVTMESEHIDDAGDAIKISLATTQRFRRKRSTLSNPMIFKTKSAQLAEFAKYTDSQCHAELCYAESLLEKALLTFIQDENLIALIKGSLKIRECYKIYKDCWAILKVKNWNSEFIRTTFESGVRFGIGAFNLMISMLPTRILKLLEFVGFEGNLAFGISELNKATNIEKSLRQPLATLLLLCYHCFIGVIVGMHPHTEHLHEAKRLISPNLVKYRSSIIFGLLRSRISFICGNFEEALQGYENTVEIKCEWRNLQDICYWELMWCHVLEGEWLHAMKYSEKMIQNSRWSKATYLYKKGVFLLELYFGTKETITDEMKNHIRNIFQNVPKLLQRIAGKSLPIEKFAAKKSKRYFEQGETLVLPGVELILVWNMFKLLNNNSTCLEKIINSCDKNLIKLASVTATKSSFYYDNIALATLLKGVSLRYLNRIPEAIDLITRVLKWNKKIKEDLYIMPFAEVELAQIAFANKRFNDVKHHIHNARSYKGYSLESRLHFRMHSIDEALKKALCANNSETFPIETFPIETFPIETEPSVPSDDTNSENDSFHDCNSDIEEKISSSSSVD